MGQAVELGSRYGPVIWEWLERIITTLVTVIASSLIWEMIKDLYRQGKLNRVIESLEARDNLDSDSNTSTVFTSDEISKAVDDISENHKHHILQDKHNRNKMVPDPKDPKNWDKIAAIISSVLASGTEQRYKNGPAHIKSLNIDGKIV